MHLCMSCFFGLLFFNFFYLIFNQNYDTDGHLKEKKLVLKMQS